MNKLLIPSQRLALTVLKIQSIAALVIAALFFLKGTTAAASALLGGLVCVFPNAIFVLITHRHAGARAARKVVNAYYLAEATKLFLTALLFGLVFALLSVEAMPLMVSFVACLLMHFASAFIKSKA